MADETTKRTLTTIFYADVAGYSRLTGVDEEGTHRRVMALLDGVAEKISSSGGTVLRYAGDAVLASFPSVLLAVETSTDIQNGLSRDTSVQIRIGINLGDVIEDRGEVFGDGVSLAARLESAAEPGGICISSTVWDQCEGKVNAAFTDGGEQQFKNIARPVRTYSWAPDSTPLDANPDISVADKPSIAVMPFDNMSGDPEQEYFSDGITEDIITELTRFQSLFVIARNSSFAFKDQAFDVKDVARKLGVQYVVEGSVRKAGERIRITAQLIDASTGNHLWAERYDRKMEDIFAVQDEVVSQIVTMVPGHVDMAGRVQAERKPTQDLNAYDRFLGAQNAIHRDYTSPEVEMLLKQVLEIDPEHALAHAWLSSRYVYDVFIFGSSDDETVALAFSHAETALKLAPDNAVVHGQSAETYLIAGKHDLAAHHIDKAIALNPNDFLVMTTAGFVKAYLGEHDSALGWINKAMRSDPYSTSIYSEPYFDVYYLCEQYELAVAQLVGWVNPPAHLLIERAAALAHLGRIDEAREAVRQFEKVQPENWDMAGRAQTFARMCARPEDAERWLEGFRKAELDV